MWVYAIKSINHNYIYVGLTNNIQKRLKQHNSNQQRSTKAYSPYELIYSIQCKDRKSARVIEKKLKSGYGKEYLKKL
jgi:putative endonuclease